MFATLSMSLKRNAPENSEDENANDDDLQYFNYLFRTTWLLCNITNFLTRKNIELNHNFKRLKFTTLKILQNFFALFIIQDFLYILIDAKSCAL